MATGTLTATPSRSTPARPRPIITIVYYVVLVALLAVIITNNLGRLLPHRLAAHVAGDSEGYLLAVLLPIWIDVVRPRLARRRSQWTVTALAAAAMLVIFLVLYLGTDIYGKIRTLNETFFALIFLIPFIQFVRRPSVRTGLATGVAALVVAAVLEATPIGGFLTALAEGIVMLVIAPFLFDATDRGILTADRQSPWGRRIIGLVLLIVLPVAFILGRDLHSSFAPVRLISGYGVRAQEAFVGMLLIALLHAVRSAVSARSHDTAA